MAGAPKKKGISLVSVDMGTTNTRAILYREGKGIAGPESEACATSYPRPGRMEQDPEDVLAAAGRAVRRLVERTGILPREIDAVVFDGVLQSLIAVDGEGKALAPATLWADKRSLRQNERLRERFDSEEARRRTGCPLHPMYFPSRLSWIREEAPDVWKRAERFVSVKEFVLQRMAGAHTADRSTASGTGIWNMETRDWDPELLALVGLSPGHLPECVEPTAVVGGMAREPASRLSMLEGTPVIIGAADGPMAHLGSVGLDSSRMSLTVATGAALRRSISDPRILPGTEAWCYYLAEGNWIQGGVIHNAGNVLRWFADTLMAPASDAGEVFAEMNRIAAAVPPGADGLCFLPLLGGERCPHDRPNAKGALHGLDFSHTRGHFARALMEGLAWSLHGVYQMLVSGAEPDLVVTGGILKSPVWLQIVADFFGKTLWVPRVAEASAWGGVMVGLKALRAIDSFAESGSFVDFDWKREPDQASHACYREVAQAYDRLYQGLYDRNTAAAE